MSSDRELCILAAKSAGIELENADSDSPYLFYEERNGSTISFISWCPLIDDGQALRLAVKLNLEVFTKDEPFDTVAVSKYGMEEIYAEHRAGDPYAATRRAIVRAAASLAPSVRKGEAT